MATPITEIRALTTPSRSRRRLRAPNEEVRARLLESARELVCDGGDAGLRIDEVAERAGVSVGTFYLYFEGKDDLITAMVVALVESLCARMGGAMTDGETTPGRLSLGVEAYLDAASQSEGAFLWYRAPRRIRTTVGDLTSWACDRQAAVIAPVIEAGIAAGELPPHDVELLSQSLVAMLQHMVAYWLEKRPRIERDEIARFMERSLRYMLTSPDGVEPAPAA